MAATLGIATLGTEVDLKGLDSGLNQAEKKTSSKFANLGKTIKTVAGGAILAGTALVVGGVGAIGAAAFDVSRQTRDVSLDMRAQFGMTAEEADRTAKLARSAWADNLGESISDVGNVMGTIIQQLGEFGVTSDEEITKATQSAIRLRDTFEVDTSMSIDAARALMERFGLTSEQAFDMMTTGLQSGLSANGDFLESITEYAPVFADAGFSAEQMYSIMESGAASGVLGTDKISDAIKEMGIRLNEGGDDVKNAFDTIGMSFDDISGFIASGDEDWADYFDDIVAGINSIEDPMERQKAQVAIFGTMAEDLGDSFTFGLTSVGTALSDMEGATDSLNAKYENFGALWEGVKRQVIDAMTPVTDKLLEWGVTLLPKIQEAAGWVAEKFTVFAGILGNFFSRMENGVPFTVNLVGLINQLAGAFGLSSEQSVALGNMLNLFVNSTLPMLVEKFNTVKDGLLAFITETVIPFVQEHGPLLKDILLGVGIAFGAFKIIFAVINWVKSFIGIIAAAKTIILTMVGVLGGPLTIIIGIVAAAIGFLAIAWKNNWFDIRGKMQAAWNFIRPFLQTAKQWLDKHIPIALEFLRNLWVNVIWPAIQVALQFAWNNIIKPIFEALKAFVINVLIPTVQDLYQKWVNVWWPAIRQALQTAWGIIHPILISLKNFILNTVIPTVRDLYFKWVNVWWPAIKRALQIAWGIIEEIFSEVGRWINDNIVPWVKFLREKWQEDWAEVQGKLEEVWAIIEPIWITLKEWLDDKLPVAAAFLKDEFDRAMGGIRDAVQPVKDLWQGFVDAVQGFWIWLKDKVFNFSINIPDLPDWMIPDSPLPLHTAWKNFSEDSKARQVDLSINLANGELAALVMQMARADRANEVSNQETNFNLTANYRYQEERTLRQEIQALQLLYGN